MSKEMVLRHVNLLNPLISSLKLIRKNKLLFFLSILFDLSFIVSVLALFKTILENKIFPILITLTDLTKNLQSFSTDTATQAQILNNLNTSVEFMQATNSLVNWVIVFAFVLMVIWIIFQGLNFVLAAKIIDKNSKFWHYVGKFTVVSIIFYLLTFFSFYLTVYLSMANSKLVVPLLADSIVNFILIMLLAVIAYFFFVNVILIRKEKILPSLKKTVVLGVMKFPKIIVTILTIFILHSISAIILWILWMVHPLIFFLGMVVILIPTIALSRILLFYSIEKSTS